MFPSFLPISCAWRAWTISDDLTKAKNLPGQALYTATLTMMMLLLLLVCVDLFYISLGLYHVDELPSNMSQGKKYLSLHDDFISCTDLTGS